MLRRPKLLPKNLDLVGHQKFFGTDITSKYWSFNNKSKGEILWKQLPNYFEKVKIWGKNTPQPSTRHHMWDRTIGFSKSDFIHLKNRIFSFKKNGFFPSKKIGFFLSKKIGFFPSKKIGFFSSKNMGFFSSKKMNSHNPISKTRLYGLTFSSQKSNCRGPRITPQCIKLNLRGLNRHPYSEIDSQIS